MCLEHKGIDAAELARRCGVSRTTLVYWTDGTTKHPRPEHLFPAARELGVLPEWLGTGQGDMTPPNNGPRLSEPNIPSAYVVRHLSEESRALLSEIERLSPDMKDVIAKLVKTLNAKGAE